LDLEGVPPLIGHNNIEGRQSSYPLLA